MIQEGYLPETFTIGADNTYKETKNQFMIWFAVWLLCVLMDSSFWHMPFNYLLVGHTHGKDDRLFSFFSKVLKGKTYITWDDFINVLQTEMRSYDMTFAHLYAMWDWTAFKTEFNMPDVHGLGRVHVVSIYRSSGIYMRWKQYMTDEAWSKSVLLMPPSKMRDVASWRPATIEPKFEMATQLQSWIDKLELFLCDGQHTVDNFASRITWLRKLIDHNVPLYTTGPPLRTIVHELLKLGNPSKHSTWNESMDNGNTLPCDQITQLFPGADHQQQPVNTLVSLESKGVGVRVQPPSVLMAGSFIICKSTAATKVNGAPMLFTMGICVAPPRSHTDDILVAWWLPGSSAERKFKSGRSKNVVDIFGTWQPMTAFTIADLKNTCMPETLVSQPAVLVMNFELDEGEIPFSVFNEIRNKGIDITGLSCSSTTRGNVYRSSVLMGIGARP